MPLKSSITIILLFFIAFFLIILSQSFGVAPYLIIFFVSFSVFLLGKDIFNPKLPGFKAAIRVIVVLILVTIGFAQAYFLLPANSFKPPLPNSLEGLGIAFHLSFTTITNHGALEYKAISLGAKFCQVFQIIISISIVGFGLNYLLTQHKEK